tara:strand:+ start:537 stop:1490 length:954 start_codon:yes stop_codon:yes gene_type:complete
LRRNTIQLTTNTTAFIEQEIYSTFILQNLHDGLLGEQFYRNVADFGSGDTINIPTIGSVTIQEGAENEAFTYNPIDTGRVQLTITDYVGDAWFVTDDMREDGYNVDALMAARSTESTRALQENFETRFLATANAAQTNANANTINGFAHRIGSAETDDVFALSQVVSMRLAFDKANVPAQGRVLIVDPVVEATLNNLVNITTDVTPFAKDILNGGMSSGMRFTQSLYGFDVIISNRLPTGNFSDGTNAVTGAVANIAMCVLDDQCKPIMGAWRRMPRVEGERNKDLRRDEFVVSSRFGLGAQRVDTLGVIITSASNI